MKTFIAMIYVGLHVVIATTLGAWLFNALLGLNVKCKDVTKSLIHLGNYHLGFQQSSRGNKLTHMIGNNTIYKDFWYLHMLALLQVYFHLWICEPKCCFRTISPLLVMSCFPLCWISRIVAIFWNAPTLPWKELFSHGHLVIYKFKGTIQFMNFLMEQYMFWRSVFPNFYISFLSLAPCLEFKETIVNHVPYLLFLV